MCLFMSLVGTQWICRIFAPWGYFETFIGSKYSQGAYLGCNDRSFCVAARYCSGQGDSILVSKMKKKITKITGLGRIEIFCRNSQALSIGKKAEYLTYWQTFWAIIWMYKVKTQLMMWFTMLRNSVFWGFPNIVTHIRSCVFTFKKVWAALKVY